MGGKGEGQRELGKGERIDRINKGDGIERRDRQIKGRELEEEREDIVNREEDRDGRKGRDEGNIK